MKTKILAAMTTIAGAGLMLAGPALACGGNPSAPANYAFMTPSGNIACDIYGDGMGANCEVREHDWVMPASTDGPFGRPCNFDFGGLELYVSQGKPAKLGCYEGVSKFKYPDQTTLGYGQSYTRGNITCDSELVGVTCTDTVTGHYFKVARESYELG